MYKNPLNNGDISDYNSLKKQHDNGRKVKKYQSVKLQTKPTELQKYYQYMTYQQPILDELNYVAERMRTEDIKKKTDDYNFTEELKIKREALMKEKAKNEKDIGTETLFDKSSTIKQDDMTPVIATDVEMEYPTEPQPQPKTETIKNTPQIQTLMSDLFGEGDNNIVDNVLSIAENAPIKNDFFELSKTDEKKKKEKTPEQLAEIEAKKAKKDAENKARKEENRQKRIQATKERKEAEKERKKAEREQKKIERQNKYLNYN